MDKFSKKDNGKNQSYVWTAPTGTYMCTVKKTVKDPLTISQLVVNQLYQIPIPFVFHRYKASKESALMAFYST